MTDKKKQGRANRNKGARVEREIVAAFAAAGIDAEKVPLSGMNQSRRFADDVVAHDPKLGDLRIEVKARKDGQGFLTLEGWKGNADILLLKRNNRQPMAVIDFELLVKLMGGEPVKP